MTLRESDGNTVDLQAGDHEPRRIARLDRVELRQVWRHEAYDFTTWLAENLDVLNEVTDLGLQTAQREQGAGPFSVDLVAEDVEGRTVVIENQLTKSNHDHLGKLITYMTAFDARAAVWIVAEPRPEHVRAVARLNESAIADFYMLKVEAVQIGTSDVAPLLTLIVGPSAETRDIGETKEDLAERHHLRRAFWTSLLRRARPRTSLHSASSGGTGTQVWGATGVPGTRFIYGVREHNAYVGVAVLGDDNEEHVSIFEKLRSDKALIEKELKSTLEWSHVEGRHRCMIIQPLGSGGYRDDEGEWPRIQDAMIEAMLNLAATMTPRLKAAQRA